MSNGGGQAKVITLSAYPGFKMYHYAAGTTTLKNIYSDEDLQTTIAQPAVADSNGVLQFYALGDFKLRIDDSGDVTRYTWDNYHISKGQPHISDYGTAYPAAATANKGHSFAKIDGSNVLRGFGINGNAAFTEIYSADASGQQIFDSVISKTMPVYNVKHEDWGALGDGSNDDTSAIQSAITAIQSTTYGGVLYFPAGKYKLAGSLTVADTNIQIVGDGPGLTTIYQSTASNGITITQASATYKVLVRDLSMTTDQALAGTALSVTWAAASSSRNFAMYNVNIEPETPATDYWSKGVILDGPFSPIIGDVSYAGKTSTVSSPTGIEAINTTGDVYINSCHVAYCTIGINVTGTMDHVSIAGNSIDYANTGVNIAPTSAEEGFVVANNRITTLTRGIVLNKTTDNVITGNMISKHSTSTDDYFGIALLSVDTDTNVSGNSIRDNGTGGIFHGIVYMSGNGALITGNHIKGDSSATLVGIQISANVPNFTIDGNIIADLTTGVVVTAGTSDNYTISNNNFVGCTTSITDGGTGTDKRIEGNHPRKHTAANPPSATTVALHEYIDFQTLTGTTTVVNFTASAIGRTITIQAAASVTITDNTGNINLAGGANYAMTVGDTLTIACDGTNWWETSRTVQ